jgi:integrase/recombinase XerC
VESPKVEKKIVPSLIPQQLDYLIDQAECVRDKAIISLFVDSGLRLSELANIEQANIDWQHRLIKVVCKGDKEGLATFVKGLRGYSKNGWQSVLLVVSYGT